MAIFESLLFGKLKKSIANLTMYKLGGQWVVRGKTQTIRNPNTLGQRNQRSKMAFLVYWAPRFKMVYDIGFPERPERQTAYAAFISANFKAFDDEKKEVAGFIWSKLSCSAGTLAVPLITVEEKDKIFEFTLVEQADTPQAFVSDRIIAVFMDQKTEYLRDVELPERGHGWKYSVDMTKKKHMERVAVYVFAVSVHGDRASNTLCVLNRMK